MLSSIRKKWYELPYLLLVPLLTGCGGTYLSVQTDYLTEENLASYHVGTPDPLLYCGSVGQRMLVSWTIPKSCPGMYIVIHLRYRDREEEVIQLNDLRPRGSYIYYLMNDEYFEKGGIATFKVELFSGDTLIEEWRHQLWVDLIEINGNSEN
jgi:hypothetical protein